MSSQGFRSWGGAVFAILAAATLTVTGALTVGGNATFGTAGQETRLRLFTEDSSGLSYWDGTAEVSNSSAPHNQVRHQGWNVDQSGNRVVAGEPSLFFSWEPNFLNPDTFRYTEFHLQYNSDDGGTTRRVLSNTVRRDNDASEWLMRGKIALEDSTGAIARFRLDDSASSDVSLGLGKNVANGGVYLTWEKNNSIALRQLNAAGTQYANLAFLNNLDEFLLGGANCNGVSLQGRTRFYSAIEPTALSGDVNDYAPTGFATATLWWIDGGAANRNITGMAGGGIGDIRVICNRGTTNTLVLVHESASSSAGNRYNLPSAGNVSIPVSGCVTTVYRGQTTTRWWLMARGF